MAKNIIGGVPFPPLIKHQSDDPINMDEFNNILNKGSNKKGLSILLRSLNGHDNRGGYFFHISTKNNILSFYDFEKNIVCSLKKTEALALINHVSGLQYDEKSYEICSKTINLKSDL